MRIFFHPCRPLRVPATLSQKLRFFARLFSLTGVVFRAPPCPGSAPFYPSNPPSNRLGKVFPSSFRVGPEKNVNLLPFHLRGNILQRGDSFMIAEQRAVFDFIEPINEGRRSPIRPLYCHKNFVTSNFQPNSKALLFSALNVSLDGINFRVAILTAAPTTHCSRSFAAEVDEFRIHF